MRGLALWLVLVTPAAAADWREELSDQLRWEHDCEVAFLSGVSEREVEGALVVLAKAHCEDGRVFDALQQDTFEDFQINECVAAEEAC